MVSQRKIIALVLALIFIYINPTISKSNDEEHKYRINYAKQMLTYMNMSVDPCEDFYEFACGNWKNVIETKPTQHRRNNMNDIEYQLGEHIHEILQSSGNNLGVNYGSEFKRAQKFYQSCVSAELYTAKMSSEYLKAIQNIGGFPAVNETWNPKEFSWFNMSAHLTNYGASGLINEWTILPQYPFPPDFKLPDLGFSYIVHSDNIASKTSNAYTMNEEQMRKYLTAYGVKKSKITVVIAEIFEFWKAVLAITDQIECLKSKDSIFTEWNNFFDIAWWGINLTDEDCPCDFFYIELDKVCKNHITAFANYLSMKFLFEMDAKLKSPDHQKDYCVSSIRSTMPYVIDKFYLRAHFSNEIHEDVSTILKELRKSLRAALEEAYWLDKSTRTEALFKESTMKTRVGNFEDNEMTDRLIREMNNLTFVEGLLYPPAYHKAWPNSLKFGTLGFLIGHEYTHGFDSVGAYIDGNLEERYWWSKKTGTLFQERIDCYIKHYNNYLIPEINRNVIGDLAINENVADSGGLREALNAYRNFMKEQSKEDGFVSKSEQMPGMDLSPEQLFFLGFAQLWCASYEILGSSHTIDKYRVLGAASNYDEFASAYSCSEKTKMNPKDKCRLW